MDGTQTSNSISHSIVAMAYDEKLNVLCISLWRSIRRGKTCTVVLFNNAQKFHSLTMKKSYKKFLIGFYNRL